MQDFQSKISELSEKIKRKKELVKSEADSESVFVEPFLEILGYKMQDIGTIKRQYPADFGRVGNEDRVDYAILQDNKPLVVIEVKHHSEKLDKHIGQLKRYFAACIKSCHFGVLANGIEYRFFSNLKDSKEMDEKPFFSLNLEQNFSKRDLKMLQMFVKGEIRVDEIKQTAQHNLYFTQIKTKIKSEIESPSDEFVGLFKEISGKQNLQKTFKQEFTKLIKQAFKGAIFEYVQEKSTQNGDENLKVNLNTFEKQSTQKSVTLNDEWKSLKPRCVKFPNGNQESVSSVREAVKVIIKYLKNNHAVKLERAIKENNFAFIHFGEVEQKATLVIMDFGSFKFAYNSSATSLRSATKKLVEACDLEPSEFEVITI